MSELIPIKRTITTGRRATFGERLFASMFDVIVLSFGLLHQFTGQRWQWLIFKVLCACLGVLAILSFCAVYDFKKHNLRLEEVAGIASFGLFAIALAFICDGVCLWLLLQGKAYLVGALFLARLLLYYAWRLARRIEAGWAGEWQ